MAEALTSIERQHVAITDLPSALSELWAQIEHSEATPLSRALTANFIGVTRSADEDALRAALDRLLVRHPCRAFLVVLDESCTEVRGELAARIRRDRRSRQTILEQIRVTTPQRSFAVIPGVIRALVVDDIPVHLFWAASLPENIWDLTTMARLADQTVVDSCNFADPAASLRGLQEVSDLNVVDLAVFRLRPWRRALAEAFELFEWQGGVSTRVVLTHGADCGAVAAAHVLSTWLDERLSAEVKLRQVGDPAPTSEPLSLELSHRNVVVKIEHSVSSPELSTTVTLDDRCQLPFTTRASRGRLGDLLGAAVDAL